MRPDVALAANPEETASYEVRAANGGRSLSRRPDLAASWVSRVNDGTLEEQKMSGWMNKLSLRAKLLGGFSVAAGLMVVACVVAVISQKLSHQAIDRLLDVDDLVDNLSARSSAAMFKAQCHANDFLLHDALLGGGSAVDTYLSLLHGETATVRANMSTIRGLTDIPEVLKRTRAIDEAIDRYESDGPRLLERSRASAADDLTPPDRVLGIVGVMEQHQSRAREIESLLEALQSEARADQVVTRDKETGPIKAGRWTFLSVSFIALSLGIVVALGCARHITRGAHKCLDFAERLAEGNLQTRLGVHGHDEFATMAVALNGMADAMSAAQAVLREELDERQRANRALTQEIEVRLRAEGKLEATHQQLMIASRRAGMAEIATGVLHNVGNVLNSVNVSATLALDRLQQSKADQLDRVCDLIEQHDADLGRFMTEDSKGKQIPSFLRLLAGNLADERARTLEELEALHSKIEHIKTIVATQQSYAGASGVVEPVDLHELLEDALKMHGASFERHGIQVERDDADLPKLLLDRQKVLQILVNLIKNAKESLLEKTHGERRIRFETRLVGEDRFDIVVRDTGVGIPRENLARIFAHGFTTKKSGHGFGLHSSANAAEELDGSLTVESDGADQGAAFALELPFQPAETLACSTTSPHAFS
jgi:signal transduction histidine kinase